MNLGSALNLILFNFAFLADTVISDGDGPTTTMGNFVFNDRTTSTHGMRVPRNHDRALQAEPVECSFDDLIATNCDMQAFCTSRLEVDREMLSGGDSLACFGNIQTGWSILYNFTESCLNNPSAIDGFFKYDRIIFDPGTGYCSSTISKYNFGAEGVLETVDYDETFTRPMEKQGNSSRSISFVVCPEGSEASAFATFGNVAYCTDGCFYDVEVNGMECNAQCLGECGAIDCSNVDPLLAYDCEGDFTVAQLDFFAKPPTVSPSVAPFSSAAVSTGSPTIASVTIPIETDAPASDQIKVTSSPSVAPVMPTTTEVLATDVPSVVPAVDSATATGSPASVGSAPSDSSTGSSNSGGVSGEAERNDTNGPTSSPVMVTSTSSGQPAQDFLSVFAFVFTLGAVPSLIDFS